MLMAAAGRRQGLLALIENTHSHYSLASRPIQPKPIINLLSLVDIFIRLPGWRQFNRTPSLFKSER